MAEIYRTVQAKGGEELKLVVSKNTFGNIDNQAICSNTLPFKLTQS